MSNEPKVPAGVRGRPRGTAAERRSPRGMDPNQEGVKFFARVKAFDIACPRCGLVWSTNARAKRAKNAIKLWDPRRLRWRCRECSLVLTLGILAWEVPVARFIIPPRDSVPTQVQARQMLSNINPGIDYDRYSASLSLSGETPNRLVDYVVGSAHTVNRFMEYLKENGLPGENTSFNVDSEVKPNEVSAVVVDTTDETEGLL